MSGQPAGAFNLLSISVEDASAINPPNIIGLGDSFTITVEFKGNPADQTFGGTWTAIRNLAQPYQIIVYAEAIGGGYEGILARTTGNLVVGQDAYSVNLPVTNGVLPGGTTLGNGLYLVGATVQIPSFPQWVGYVQDTFVQVATGA